MEVNELLRNLQNIIDQEKDKFHSDCALRIDWMAEDCIKVIKELQNQISKSNKSEENK